MVHITDVKKIILMEQVADEYEKLGKEGRFSKKCIPRGYIPDFDWTTIHDDPNQPIKPTKQEDPIEGTTTPTTPTEVEDPQVVTLDPKPSNNQPISRNNWNTIQHQWIHWNAIQPKLRSTKCKLQQKTVL